MVIKIFRIITIIGILEVKIIFQIKTTLGIFLVEFIYLEYFLKFTGDEVTKEGELIVTKSSAHVEYSLNEVGHHNYC